GVPGVLAVPSKRCSASRCYGFRPADSSSLRPWGFARHRAPVRGHWQGTHLPLVQLESYGADSSRPPPLSPRQGYFGRVAVGESGQKLPASHELPVQQASPRRLKLVWHLNSCVEPSPTRSQYSFKSSGQVSGGLSNLQGALWGSDGTHFLASKSHSRPG